MNTKEQLLLESTIGDNTVRMQLRTRTCIDVGLWWWQRPIWLCITANELVLLAISRRKYVERLTLADLRDIHYSAAGGELVISSEPALRFPRLKMPTSTALEVIELIQQPSPTTNTPTP